MSPWTDSWQGSASPSVIYRSLCRGRRYAGLRSRAGGLRWCGLTAMPCATVTSLQSRRKRLAASGPWWLQWRIERQRKVVCPHAEGRRQPGSSPEPVCADTSPPEDAAYGRPRDAGNPRPAGRVAVCHGCPHHPLFAGFPRLRLGASASFASAQRMGIRRRGRRHRQKSSLSCPYRLQPHSRHWN